MRYLIVGLGNPGEVYQETRHNVGFKIVTALATKQGWAFKSASDLPGRLAQGTLGSTQLLLLLPSTFMNLSGEAVKACMAKWNVPVDHLIVVSDDVTLPLGTLRLRSQGSSGGHNGLKNIEAQLGTQYYARLRVGVGASGSQVLSDYVLDPFLKEEKSTVEESIAQAVGVLETWAQLGLAKAMQQANARKLKEEGEQNG